MSQPLFGLVPAGQPVITDPTEAPSPTSFLYAIQPVSPAAPASKPFSYIAIFLLPGVALPPDSAAAIYLVTPAPPGQSTPTSRFLAGIGPGKESAILNVGGGTSASAAASNPVVIGISVEPAGSVAQRVAERTVASSSSSSGGGNANNQLQQQQQQAVDTRPSTLVLAQRIIKNAFNFLSGFSGTAGQVEVVPLKAFEDWWRKFESRVGTDPGFLERDD